METLRSVTIAYFTIQLDEMCTHKFGLERFSSRQPWMYVVVSKQESLCSRVRMRLMAYVRRREDALLSRVDLTSDVAEANACAASGSLL